MLCVLVLTYFRDFPTRSVLALANGRGPPLRMRSVLALANDRGAPLRMRSVIALTNGRGGTLRGGAVFARFKVCWYEFLSLIFFKRLQHSITLLVTSRQSGV